MEDETREADQGPQLISIISEDPIGEEQELKRKIANLKKKLKRYKPPKQTQQEALCTIVYHNMSRQCIPGLENLIKTCYLEETPPGYSPSGGVIVHYYRMPEDIGFQIDTLPATHTERSEETPAYELGDWNTVPLGTEETEIEAIEENRCFNCGDPSHSCAECPQPKDKERIQRNRHEYLQSRPAKFTGRYATSQEILFSKFQPGALSAALREALDIQTFHSPLPSQESMKEGDLPPYYPRMKKFGYPPGYLGYKSSSLPPTNLEEPEDVILLQRKPADGVAFKMANFPDLDAPIMPRQWRMSDERDIPRNRTTTPSPVNRQPFTHTRSHSNGLLPTPPFVPLAALQNPRTAPITRQTYPPIHRTSYTSRTPHPTPPPPPPSTPTPPPPLHVQPIAPPPNGESESSLKRKLAEFLSEDNNTNTTTTTTTTTTNSERDCTAILAEIAEKRKQRALRWRQFLDQNKQLKEERDKETL